MRGTVTQRRFWQGFLDWFRPVAREASMSQKAHRPPSAVNRMGSSIGSGAEAVCAADMSEGDLLEFLAADLDPVPADPVFREDLRERLWSLVQDGATARPKDH